MYMTGNMVQSTFVNTHTHTPPPLPSPKRRRYPIAAPASAWVYLTESLMHEESLLTNTMFTEGTSPLIRLVFHAAATHD